MNPEPLYGKTLEELRAITTAEGLPRFAANQLTEWLYKHNATAIEQMSNLSKKARSLLSEKYCVGLTLPDSVSESADGTKKYLFTVTNNRYIETAYIPDNDRATLCISSQIGCKMGCQFCMTAKQGFQGNLTANRILNQLRSIPEFSSITNIVYMGMGEPFDNLDNVLRSLDILTSPWGMGWSPKRITVSSIGIIPALQRFLSESRCHLAISLHTPFDAEREKIMPAQKAHPIKRVVDIIRKTDIGGQRRVSFEYILFEGFNDSPAHIKELVKLLSGIQCRVNLIRFHSIPGSSLRGTSEQKMVEFRDALTSRGIFTTIRASRGEDIQAACGLLSTKALLNKNKPDHTQN